MRTAEVTVCSNEPPPPLTHTHTQAHITIVPHTHTLVLVDTWHRRRESHKHGLAHAMHKLKKRGGKFLGDISLRPFRSKGVRATCAPLLATAG
jgi:hypothetical protein